MEIGRRTIGNGVTLSPWHSSIFISINQVFLEDSVSDCSLLLTGLYAQMWPRPLHQCAQICSCGAPQCCRPLTASQLCTKLISSRPTLPVLNYAVSCHCFLETLKTIYWLPCPLGNVTDEADSLCIFRGWPILSYMISVLCPYTVIHHLKSLITQSLSTHKSSKPP